MLEQPSLVEARAQRDVLMAAFREEDVHVDEGRYRSAAEQNTAPNVAHDLAERTAVDVVAVAGALGSFNFLLDATYGTSTYEEIDAGNVYYVYRTTTGIITRHEPRPVPPPEGEALSITIEGACGGYEDVYVRTAEGWRIQSRTHVRNKAWHAEALRTPDLN